MTLFEALKFNREPLEMLIKLGIKQDDVRYIDLYSEFEAMKNRGEKTTYAVLYLANKYSVCERKVYDVLSVSENAVRLVQCDLSLSFFCSVRCGYLCANLK